MLLLRHGQSEWNALRRWQGRADTPLTDLGRRQAVQCADELARRASSTGRQFGSVWSSTLGRAEETATIISGCLSLGTVTTDVRLCEADAGEWEGLTPHEIERGYPGFLAGHRRPDTFESPVAVIDRAWAALNDIADEHRGDADVLVVTHSGVLRSIVRHLGTADERIPNLGGIWARVVVNGLATDGSVIDGPIGSGVRLDQRFRFEGISTTSVDGPGEDPGDEPDQPDADRCAQR